VEVEGNRRRSSSDPQRLSWVAAGGGVRTGRYMPDVREEGLNTAPGSGIEMPQRLGVPAERNVVRRKSSMASVAGSLFRLSGFHSSAPPTEDEEQGDYNEELVDVLDAVGM
jgi:hypothetical protein